MIRSPLRPLPLLTLLLRRPCCAVGWVMCLLAACLGARGASGFARGESGTPRAYTITSWSTKDGLPADRVRHLWEDKLGFLWIATFNGVSRFDGVRFRNYDVSNTPGLANNLINALYEDRGGTMWLGHDTGEITVWRGGRFERLPVDPEWLGSPIDQFGETGDGTVWARNRLSWLLPVTELRPGAIRKTVGGQRISDIASGGDGRLWLVGEGGVFSLDSSAIDEEARMGRGPVPHAGDSIPHHARPGGGSNLEIPMRWEGPAQVFRARGGGVWVADHERVRRWVDGEWTGESVSTQVRQRTWTNTWMELSDGRLAVSTYDEGLQILPREGGVQRLDSARGLAADYATALVEDREGNLWIGVGDRGVSRLRPSMVEMVEPPGGWGNWSVQAVISARDGSVWAGTEGAGIFRLSKSEWTRLDRDAGLTNLTVKTMVEDAQGQIWAGLTNGDFGVFEAGRFRPRFTDPAVGPLTAAFQSQRGELWIGGLIGLGRIAGDRLTVVRPTSGQFAQISGFAETGDGSLWIASLGNGLGRYRNGSLEVLRSADGLPSEYLWSLHSGGDGTLWIGTYDRGLVAYRGGRFRQVETARVLPGNMVAQIAEDESGALWLGTNGGIVRLSRAELERFADGDRGRVSPEVFDASEGLTARAFSGGSQAGVCRTRDGLLWFATDRGLARVDPKLPPPPAPLAPVIIETVRIDGVVVEVAGRMVHPSVEVEPGSRRLEIDYAGLGLTAPHRVLFRYQMEGAEEGWAQAGTRRTAYFSYLRPGRYVFRVQSVSADGAAGPEASLPVYVKPHFWETRWFAVAAFALALGVVAIAVYWGARQRHRRQIARMEQAHAIERDRTRIAHDIHDEIGSGLTQLSILSHAAPGGDAGEKEEMSRLREIERTVTEMTAAIDEIVWAVNPRHDSLESLVSYLVGVVQEFSRRVGLHCHIDVPFELERLAVTAEFRHELYLVVREALQNVAKHAAASEVRFAIRRDSEGLLLRLEDNGRGFPPQTSGGGAAVADGIGLESMRQRTAKLGGEVSFTNRPEGGAAVVVRLALPRGAVGTEP